MTFKANAMDANYAYMDSLSAINTMVFPIVFEQDIDISRLEEAVVDVVERIPILRSKLKMGWWADHWQVDRSPTGKAYMINIMDISAGYGEDINIVQHLLNDNVIPAIDAYREFPLKVYIVSDRRIVICFHHSYSDARGCLKTIELLGRCYNHPNTDDATDSEFNRRLNVHQSLLSSIKRPHRSALFKNMQVQNKQFSNCVAKTDSLCGINQGSTDKVNYVIYRLPTEQFARIKQLSAFYHVTINDFMLLCLAKLNWYYRHRSGVANQLNIIGYVHDARKYMKTHYTVGNYILNATMFLFSHMRDMRDAELLKHIATTKSSHLSLEIGLMSLMMRLMPAILQRQVMRMVFKPTKNQIGDKMLFISNAGRIDFDPGTWNNMIKDIVFIGNLPLRGNPNTSVSSYRNTMTFTICHAHSTELGCQDMSNRLRELINDTLLSLWEERDAKCAQVNEVGS